MPVACRPACDGAAAATGGADAATRATTPASVAASVRRTDRVRRRAAADMEPPGVVRMEGRCARHATRRPARPAAAESESPRRPALRHAAEDRLWPRVRLAGCPRLRRTRLRRDPLGWARVR